MSRGTSLRSLRLLAARGTALALLACGFGSAVALANPPYEIAFVGGSDNTSSSPLRLSNSWSSGNSAASAQGYAIPGRVWMHDGIVTAFGSLFSEGSADEARAANEADDFIISGPPGATSVTGTLHFTATASLAVGGGYPSNNAHHVLGSCDFAYYDPSTPLAVSASCFDGNYNAYGTGFMSSFTPPGGSYDATITTSFPVGHAFVVRMVVDVASQTYGNISVAPGSSDGTLGGVIGDISGHVMDLPAGYTLNSTSWGVANNQVGATAAVESDAATRARFLGAFPNPTRGASTITFSLARAGQVWARLLDISGRTVRTWGPGVFGAGARSIAWDGRDDAGRTVAPGVYFVRLDHPDGSLTGRLVRVN